MAYNEDSISVIKGLDQVRKRPVLYMGARGNAMLWRMIKEAVDNAVDEAMAGRNDYIEVHVDTKNSLYIIRDCAEGIPIGVHKTEKKSTLEVVMTQLHAGGKFNDKNYKFSSGTHGLGISATNALSKNLNVWTFREGICYGQSYEIGKPKEPVKKITLDKKILARLKNKTKRGTVIAFSPDQSVIAADGVDAVIEKRNFLHWLQNLAYLNKGLKICVNVDGKEFEFLNKIGPEMLLRKLEKTLSVERSGKSFIFESANCTCAFAFSNYSEIDGIKSFVCNSPTKHGGTHLKGLLNVLVKVLSKHALKKEKFNNKDLTHGIIGVLNWRMSEPEFTSQVKDELDSNVTKEVEELLYAPIEAFFEKNKKLARDIIKRASAITLSREQYKKVLRSISEVKKSSRKTLLPNVLASAAKARPDKRTLYVVEGDSAYGTCKKARDSSFQEVLKLKGKPVNAMKASVEDVLSNEAIQNLMIALDVDVDSQKRKKTFDCDNLRVRDVFLLADSDADGYHINLLMIAFFYRFLPDLIKQGRLHVVDAPLFFGFYKNKRYIGSTFQDCYSQMPKGAPKHCVIRAKGWGEVEAEALSLVAFKPETRSYITLDYPKTKEMLERYVNIVGESTETRKEILGL